MLADLSLEYGVSSFIYSSVERGGEGYDDNLELDRLAKVRIERHIRQLGTRGLPWTCVELTSGSSVQEFMSVQDIETRVLHGEL